MGMQGGMERDGRKSTPAADWAMGYEWLEARYRWGEGAKTVKTIKDLTRAANRRGRSAARATTRERKRPADRRGKWRPSVEWRLILCVEGGRRNAGYRHKQLEDTGDRIHGRRGLGREGSMQRSFSSAPAHIRRIIREAITRSRCGVPDREHQTVVLPILRSHSHHPRRRATLARLTPRTARPTLALTRLRER